MLIFLFINRWLSESCEIDVSYFQMLWDTCASCCDFRVAKRCSMLNVGMICLLGAFRMRLKYLWSRNSKSRAKNVFPQHTTTSRERSAKTFSGLPKNYDYEDSCNACLLQCTWKGRSDILPRKELQYYWIIPVIIVQFVQDHQSELGVEEYLAAIEI